MISPNLSHTIKTFPNEYINMRLYANFEKKSEIPPLFDNFTRTTTPCINFINLVQEEKREELVKSLFFIGKARQEVSENRSKITNESFRHWNNGHRFSVYRFGFYITPIGTRAIDTFAKRCEIWFSSSNIQICYTRKAEIMLFIYYKFPDNIMVKKLVQYAIYQYHAHVGQEFEKMARYLFELAFAFDFLVTVNDERKSSLPMSSTTQTVTLRYNKFSEHGTFKLDESGNLQKVPRSVTNIPYDENIVFYIPYTDEIIDKSTECAKNSFELAEKESIPEAYAASLACMFSYMQEYLSQSPEQPEYIQFESNEEAENFVKTKKEEMKEIIDDIDKVKFCLKVCTAPGKYESIVY